MFASRVNNAKKKEAARSRRFDAQYIINSRRDCGWLGEAIARTIIVTARPIIWIKYGEGTVHTLFTLAWLLMWCVTLGILLVAWISHKQEVNDYLKFLIHELMGK